MLVPCPIFLEPHFEKHWLTNQNSGQQIIHKYIPGIYSPPVLVLCPITKNMAIEGQTQHKLQFH